MLRSNGCGNIVRGCRDKVYCLLGRHMFHDNAQVRELGEETLHVPVNEFLFSVKEVDTGVRDFPGSVRPSTESRRVLPQ